MNYPLRPLRKTPPNSLLPYLPIWMNNDSKHLGIVQFAFYFFSVLKPKYGVAPWAVNALKTVLHYEPGMGKEDRCHVIATYRSGSKTTWFAFVWQIYNMLVGEYGIYWEDNILPETKYQLLKGKTGTEGKKRLYNISSALNSKKITDIFGNIKPSLRQTKDKKGKDSSSLMILPNGSILEGSGIDQPTRGANIEGYRLGNVVADDPENIENTLTQGSREKNSRQIMEEIFGAVEDDGMIIYIGNKIHRDDTIGKMLNPENKVWKKQFYTYTVVRKDGKVLPGIGDLDVEEPEWTKRYTINDCRKRKAWFANQPELGGVKAFLKEYYNIIKSDADYKVKYYDGQYVREFETNWIRLKTPNGYEYRNINIIVGEDPAITEKKTGCDAVVAVVGIDYLGNRYILEISKGKYDVRDRYYEDDKRPPIIATTPEELSNVKRKGNAEEAVRMFLKYHADGIVIETVQLQKGIFNDVKELLERLGRNTTVMPYSPRSEKIATLRECPLNLFEVGLYHLKEGEMRDLENELATFPDTKLDTLDGLRMAEQLLMKPHRMERGYFNVENPQEENSFKPVKGVDYFMILP